MSTPKKNRVPPNSKKSETLTIRLTRDEAAAIRAGAAREGRTMRDYVVMRAVLHQLEETSYATIRRLQLKLNQLDHLIGRLSDNGKLDDTSYTALCDVIHRGE